MNTISAANANPELLQQPAAPHPLTARPSAHKSESELRETFNDFVGQTFFGTMMKTMRQSVGKPAYFHGGRGEEAFQAQLDQILVEKVSDASAEKVAEPMFDLFMLRRQ